MKNGQLPVVPGEGTPWRELHLESHLANTTEDIDRNVESALSRFYISFQELVGTKKGAVAVVGSGPSLKKNWKKLLKFDGEIIACNAAFQFLLERGVIADYMFCFDADPLMYEFITPVKGVVYLLASRVPPRAFDMLEGHKVVLWHAAGDENIEKILEKHEKFNEPMVIGGSAAVTRCMVLAQTMGFKDIHIFGGDSSFLESDTHIRQSTTVERHMQILVNRRIFWTAPWMTKQAEDFKTLVPPLMNIYGINFIIHGDGLIPHIARTMGLEVKDGETKAHQMYKNMKYKSAVLWNKL